VSDELKARRVWDPFVRVFHWSLLACVLLNEFAVDDGETLHQWLGYAALALVGLRIVWGFVGTRHARCSMARPNTTGATTPWAR